MVVELINPVNGEKLKLVDNKYVDLSGNEFSVVNEVLRICSQKNYTENFGIQWNKFIKTQIDNETTGLNLSRQRFFAETRWDQQDLTGQCILEVGSGAGRFSSVVLKHTNATLYSVDYSDAVTANFKNNSQIAPDRFNLFQASVYELPFKNNSFDKVFCLGVLQHTPDFEASIKELIGKAKQGGEIVVDFYPIKGWWTKIHAKYILRHITTKMSHQSLLRLVESHLDWLITAHGILTYIGLGFMTRFLPLCDVTHTIPKTLTKSEIREWAILDTFDMYSPEHDNPQRISNVSAMFKRHGAEVTFAGFEHFDNFSAAVVRGIKHS